MIRHSHIVLRSFVILVLMAQAIGLATPIWAQENAPLSGGEYSARIVAAKEVDIAARIDGRLASINFTAGQVVRKGDVLFEFDTKFRQISLDAADAGLRTASAQLSLAEVKLKAAERLNSRDVTSDMQLLEAQAEREVAAAKVDEARAAVAAAQLQLEQTSLRASMDGMVGPSAAREGAYLTLDAIPDNRLATVTQLNPIHVIGQVPFEAYARSQAEFETRTEAVDALVYTLILPGGEVYPMTGELIGGTGEFNADSQTIAITVEFENPDFLLRPGLDVTLRSSNPL